MEGHRGEENFRAGECCALRHGRIGPYIHFPSFTIVVYEALFLGSGQNHS